MNIHHEVPADDPSLGDVTRQAPAAEWSRPFENIEDFDFIDPTALDETSRIIIEKWTQPSTSFNATVSSFTMDMDEEPRSDQQGLSQVDAAGSELDRLVRGLCNNRGLVEGYYTSGGISALPASTVLAAIDNVRASVLDSSSIDGSFRSLDRGQLSTATRRQIMPLPETQTDLEILLTGHNTRWETIGIILSVAGLAVLRNREAAEKDVAVASSSSTARSLLRASNTSVDICLRQGDVNEFTTCLLCENLSLLTHYYGSASEFSMNSSHIKTRLTSASQSGLEAVE